MGSWKLLTLLLLIALASTVFIGCAKPAPLDDLTVDPKDRGDQTAGSKKAAAADDASTDEPGGPPNFLWKGDDTKSIAASFGPAGPSPLLLFGTMIEHGEADISGSETSGGISMADPSSLDLRYERDDDIKDFWVMLDLPEGDHQFFAGMAVYGTINWERKGAAGTHYEAESAIYLTEAPFADVLAFYERARKEWNEEKPPWPLIDDVPPAAQAALGETRDWLFRSPDASGLEEVFIAEVADTGVTQITLARTVTISDDVLNGLENYDPKSLEIHIPEPPNEPETKGAKKGGEGEAEEAGAAGEEEGAVDEAGAASEAKRPPL